MSRDLSSLLRVCVDAAKAAGDYALENKPRRAEIHERFSHDVKLKLDHESQARAFAAVQMTFPDDAILGEEGENALGQGDYEWVIDPIDGTVNFFHGLNWWCSSVAVRSNGKVLAGAVYAPEIGFLYQADAESESRMNGNPVRPSTIEALAEALVVTGSEKEMAPGQVPLATAQKMAPHVQKIRILGAAALDMCQVASGAVDVFCQKGLYIWDIAAAGLIIQQSGGIYQQRETDVKGRYATFASATQALADDFGKTFPDLLH